MAKINETETKTINLIGTGTMISGDINSNGDIRIDGGLKGNLITKGKVVVGQTGSINGEVDCKNADISGKIEGKIKVSELLSLKLTANIFGDIITNKLSIEPGANFSGSCNMKDNTPTPLSEEKRKL
ncbi:MAG: polymer-forming cytoskeletal protein [Bacteroidales bacterium]|nr:polymer-forming cytoskeletal protein [Bacteroidales bacterium]